MNLVGEYRGRTITAVEMVENALVLMFDDGTAIRVLDTEQHCCERRYMTADKDLPSLIGCKLTRIEIKAAAEFCITLDDGDPGFADIQFVEIGTDKGFVTIANHNEHNGYYDGFRLTIKEIGRVAAPVKRW